ncbi:MAG: proprotein convertase P-domain-containing protein [Actinobacteria bacterium]|nr:proprotein convertase P-domain-containing protein [Actinomycetota bacterium]
MKRIATASIVVVLVSLVSGGTAAAATTETVTAESACPTGFTPTTRSLSSSDVPKRVPPGSASSSSTPTESTLTVPEAGAIQDIDVLIGELRHSFDSDLVISIVGPDGTEVMLSDRRGGSGDDFLNTVFDDEAPDPISSGNAPFSGRFRPEQALSALDGKEQQGTFTLRILDNIAADVGELRSWGLEITTCVDTTPPPTPKQCSDGRDNDRDGRTDYPADPGCSSAADNNEANDPRPPATQCTIRGTSGNDMIRGTRGDDVICAGAGNDVVYGRGGDDIILGGEGNDVLRGGDGHDRLSGGAGNDVLRGGDGNDRLSGGDGNDVLRGGDGDDRLVGGPGRDVLYGQEGRDFLDTRDDRRGNDVARGGPGDDDCETDRGDVRSSC